MLPTHAEYGFGYDCFYLSLAGGVFPRLSVAKNLSPVVVLVFLFTNWKALQNERAFSWRWLNILRKLPKFSVAASLVNLCWPAYRVDVGYINTSYVAFAGDLEVGYYLWVGSFMLLALGSFRLAKQRLADAE